MAAIGLGRAIVLAAALAAGAAGAATLKVKAGNTVPDDAGCGAGSNPCNTIQAGIDHAQPGDVVSVAKGDYAENVVVAIGGIRITGSGALLGDPLDSCPGEPARTTLATCSELTSQPECGAGWQLDGSELIPRATSCAWDGLVCYPCNPENAEALLCNNACTPTTPAALTIAADGVTVEKLRVRAPQAVGIAIEDGAEDATVRGVRIEGAGSACIAVSGDAAEINGASARGCGGGGILVDADAPVIAKNRVTGTDDAGIRVRGPDAVLERNSVTLTGGACVRSDGDRVTIERNKLSLCGGIGLDVRGTGVHVLANTVRTSDTGIEAECRALPTICADATRTQVAACAAQGSMLECEATAQLTANNGVVSCFWNGACSPCNLNQAELGNCSDSCLPGGDAGYCGSLLVDGNKVTETNDGPCLAAEGLDGGMAVSRNKLSLCAEGGVTVSGVIVDLRDNQVSDCGSRGGAPGFLLQGRDHRLLGNVVRGCSGDGFRVEDGAEIMSFSDNQAIDNGGDGFDVEAAIATLFDRCVASNNVGNGFEISADAQTTTLEQSRASGNLLDLCDDGSVTTISSSSLGTTGTGCLPD